MLTCSLFCRISDNISAPRWFISCHYLTNTLQIKLYKLYCLLTYFIAERFQLCFASGKPFGNLNIFRHIVTECHDLRHRNGKGEIGDGKMIGRYPGTIGKCGLEKRKRLVESWFFGRIELATIEGYELLIMNNWIFSYCVIESRMLDNPYIVVIQSIIQCSLIELQTLIDHSPNTYISWIERIIFSICCH